MSQSSHPPSRPRNPRSNWCRSGRRSRSITGSIPSGRTTPSSWRGGSVRCIRRGMLLGRPALPASLADADIVHATNPAAVPPVHDDQRLVVTVHDLAFQRFPELFPHDWRWLYRAGLRAATKRADAILVPSQSTADDLTASTSIPASRVHVTPLAPSLVSSDEDPAETGARLGVTQPYVLSVGTLEPRKNLVRLVRAYRQVAPDVPHALVLAGAPGWAIGGVGRRAREERTRDGRSDGLPLRRGSRRAVSRRGRVRLSIAARRLRPSGARSDVTRRPDARLQRVVAPPGRRRRRPSGGPEDVAESPRARSALDGAGVRRGPPAARPAAHAAAFTWATTARATLEVYRESDGSVVREGLLISTVKDASTHSRVRRSVAAQTRRPDEVIDGRRRLHRRDRRALAARRGRLIHRDREPSVPTSPGAGTWRSRPRRTT